MTFPLPAPSPEGRAWRIADLLLLTALIGGGLWLWLGHAPIEGSRAVVRCQGRQLAWWPLSGPTVQDTVQGLIGPVVIEHGNGKARILQAPCPNLLCVRQGAVRHVHDRLSCLPSAVTVTIEGKGTGEELDALQ